MSPKVVVLEFNELSPGLMDRFIAAGDLPNFRRLRDISTTWTTDAEVPDGEELNPWVQWVTVHTGLAAGDHGAMRLGEPVEVGSPAVAEVVSEAGGTVWLCSPMNHPRPQGRLRGALLPDPWCGWLAPAPSELADVHRFVSAQVQEHTNEAVRLDRRATRRFVTFLGRHGLRPSTAAALVGQLVGERIGRRARWQRAMALDRIQWDLFRWYRRRLDADYATFFSNSTAHAQHLYWQDMEPAAFPDHDPDPRLAGAIKAGYQAMDRIVAEAIELCADHTTLVLCTALSQQPNLTGAMLDRACFYRPRDFRSFCERLGIEGVIAIAPVMAEEFHLRFGEPAAALAGADRLRAATISGEPAFAVRHDHDDVFVGCNRFQPLPDEAALELADRTPIPLGEVLYRAEAPRSGTHHPDGLLWIHEPGQRRGVDGGRASLRAVAPTLLALLGIEPPPAMSGVPLGLIATEHGPT